MFIDQITLAEGAVLENLTVASGTLFPPHANSGELFFRTDIEGGVLFIYASGQWLKSANISNVTAASIGLGNVSNTSDSAKPVSIAQQAALDLKANVSSLAPVALSGSYDDLMYKPTAASFNLGSVDNTSDANKPISTATQGALDLKADISSLSLVATSGSYNDLLNKPPTVTLISLGLNNVNNTSDANKPISTAQQTALNLKANISSLAAVATSGSYLDLINTPTINPITLGLHVVATSGNYNDLSNKPVITATSLGLGNVDNTSDVNKPISTATQGALDLKANSSSLATVATSGSYVDLSNKPVITPATLGLHAVATSGNYNDLANKPIVTAASLGLGNVDDVPDIFKPISNATQNALDLKADIASLPVLASIATTGSYNDLVDVPPGAGVYTLPIATDTILGGVKIGAGITIDVDGVISAAGGGGGGGSYTLPVASTTVLGGIKVGTGLLMGVDGLLNTDLHSVATSGDYNDLSNKPTITKVTLGLSNVDNTSDANKPISIAQASVNSLKADTASLAAIATSGLYSDLVGAPVITPASLGLATVATSGSYNDLSDKPIDAGSITKADIGLGNVDNTSDATKPVSSAQQAALDLKVNITSLATVASSGDYNDLSNKPTITTATKESVGLGNVDNTSDLAKAISTATQDALDLKADITSLATVAISAQYLDLIGIPSLSVVAQTGDYTDLINIPAPITKADIGLGDVDNTSDVNKIISNLTQTALNLKADISALGATAFSNDYNDLNNLPSGGGSYTLPTASASTLGGIKVGSGLAIDGNGTLSSSGGGGSAPESLSPFLLMGA